MSKRSHVNFKKDRRIFKKTANRVHSGNLASPAMRGGLMKWLCQFMLIEIKS